MSIRELETCVYGWLRRYHIPEWFWPDLQQEAWLGYQQKHTFAGATTAMKALLRSEQKQADILTAYRAEHGR